MDLDRLYLQVQTSQRRLFVGVLITTLLLLVLSLQFAPAWGGDFWYLLVASWLLFFISLVAGLVRWLREIEMLRHEYHTHSASDLEVQAEARRLHHRAARWARTLGRVQLAALALGLLVHLVFASENYLSSLQDQGADECMDENAI